MMKKLFLAVIGLLSVAGMSGRTLSPAEALTRLQGADVASKAPAMKLNQSEEMRLVLTETTESGLPAVYVFENDAAETLLFVSADDVAIPLLGYTDRAEADATDMPPQLQWWLKEYARQIAYAQLGNIATPANDLAANDATAIKPLAASNKSYIAPMIQTSWDQGAPYNADCPSGTGGTAYTGCVATAMAQVMKYFQWPAKATGTGTATFQNKTYTLNLSTITFDWANMLNEYPTATSGTTAQRKAVSQLMVACGYSVNMSYSTSGSGAQSIYVPSAMVNNFGYDSGAYMASREYYSRTDWEDMIYNNLQNIGPVYYAGSSTDGGHAFVCDGYNTDGYFHFNWGWSGAYNGYYSLQALNPDGQGIGGFAGGYNFAQEVVLGIQKPTGSSSQTRPVISSINGLTATVSSNVLTLQGGFANMEAYNVSADLYIKFVSQANGSVVRGKVYSISLPSYNYYSTQTYTIPATLLSNGTYDVYMETTAVSNTSTYYPFLVPMGLPDHFTLTRNGNTYSVTNQTIGTPTITYNSLFSEIYYSSSSRMVASNPSASFTITNNTQAEQIGGVGFQIVSGKSVYAYTTGVFYDLMPGESQTVDNTFTVSLYYYPTVGTTYDLYVFDPNTNYYPNSLTNSTKVATVKFVEYPGCTLSATSFAINGNSQSVDPKSVPFKATIKCTQGIYSDVILAAVFQNSTNVGQGNLAMLNLKAGEQADITGTLTTSLQPNTNYTAGLYYLNILRQSYTQFGSLSFRTGATSGIESIEFNEAEALRIAYDPISRSLMAASSAEVKAVNVMAVNGLAMTVSVAYQGSVATADLSAVPAGIYVVRAADADGNVVTEKIAVQ